MSQSHLVIDFPVKGAAIAKAHDRRELVAIEILHHQSEPDAVEHHEGDGANCGELDRMSHHHPRLAPVRNQRIPAGPSCQVFVMDK